jgi:hypothetical protein
MKSFGLAFSVFAFVLTSTAFAHGDHPPPPKVANCKAKDCTKDEVTDGVVNKMIPMLIENGKIDSTWKGIKTTTAEQKEFKSGKEWVVTAKNDKVTDKAKQTLYVFVTLDGTLGGVNFTGQ